MGRWLRGEAELPHQGCGVVVGVQEGDFAVFHPVDLGDLQFRLFSCGREFPDGGEQGACVGEPADVFKSRPSLLHDRRQDAGVRVGSSGQEPLWAVECLAGGMSLSSKSSVTNVAQRLRSPALKASI